MAVETDVPVYVYGLMIIGFGAMLFWIYRRAQENRAKMLLEKGPKVAGEDELGGAAKNPAQFNEPDDDALEEMDKLLEDED